MNKNVFVDAGANRGVAFNDFRTRPNLDLDHCDYYLIEPNPRCIRELQGIINTFEEKYKDKVIIINKALYVHDSTIPIYGRNPTEIETMSEGLSLLSDHNTGWYTPVEIAKVPCIDVVPLLYELSKKYENIYMKFDIESSEYDVLERMLNDADCSKIREIWVEWHEQYFAAQHRPSYEKRRKVITGNLSNKEISQHSWH